MRNNILKKGLVFGIILLFIGASVIPFIASSEKEGGGWWNENWPYCCVLPVINPSNSYQMKIVVGKSLGGDVNCNGHCKDDFGDIRFLNIDNSTELPYWLESYSTGNQATFWVKLPSDVQSHPKILMYYGNADASSMSNGKATFLWFDDFQTNTTGDWKKVEFNDQRGWNFYNTKYHSPMHSARLRSNLDCISTQALNWGGDVFQGLKAKDDSIRQTNSTVLTYTYNGDSSAYNGQPLTRLISTNATGLSETPWMNFLRDGTNGYISELLYSYSNQYLRGTIWDSSNNLLWDETVSSYIPDNMTYLHWYLKDYHSLNGGSGASTGLFYDSIHKKLLVNCIGSGNSNGENNAWLKLRYSWMFLGTYVNPEPFWGTPGVEQLLRSPNPPLMLLLYPVGGEVLKGTVTVKWSALDSIDGDNLPIYLYLSNDDGVTWSAFKGNPYSNTGKLDWDTATLSDGTYKLLIEAVNSNGNIGADTSNQFQIKNHEATVNHEPVKPEKPLGPIQGKVGVGYSYTTSTTDPDGDQMYYLWDWGDGTQSGWLGLYDSGATCEVRNTWTEKSSYSIKVKAKDIYGKESAWSDPLPITMPYSFNRPMLQFLELLFQRFPHAFPLLRQVFGY